MTDNPLKDTIKKWSGTLTGAAIGTLVAGPVGMVLGGIAGYAGYDVHKDDKKPDEKKVLNE